MATKNKKCVKCKKAIDFSKDKYSLLGTYHGEKILDESFFHFNCFVQYFNEKVKEKATNTIKQAQGMVVSKISQVLSALKGNKEIVIE